MQESCESPVDDPTVGLHLEHSGYNEKAKSVIMYVFLPSCARIFHFLVWFLIFGFGSASLVVPRRSSPSPVAVLQRVGREAKRKHNGIVRPAWPDQHQDKPEDDHAHADFSGRGSPDVCSDAKRPVLSGRLLKTALRRLFRRCYLCIASEVEEDRFDGGGDRVCLVNNAAPAGAVITVFSDDGLLRLVLGFVSREIPDADLSSRSSDSTPLSIRRATGKRRNIDHDNEKTSVIFEQRRAARLLMTALSQCSTSFCTATAPRRQRTRFEYLHPMRAVLTDDCLLRVLVEVFLSREQIPPTLGGAPPPLRRDSRPIEQVLAKIRVERASKARVVAAVSQCCRAFFAAAEAERQCHRGLHWQILKMDLYFMGTWGVDGREMRTTRVGEDTWRRSRASSQLEQDLGIRENSCTLM